MPDSGENISNIVQPATSAELASSVVGVFLAGYRSERSRETMLQGLERCARVMNPPQGRPVEEIPWHQLSWRHTNAVRARLLPSYGPRTVNVTLSALRGVLRTCWKLGLMTHEAFAEATAWDSIKGDRLPAGRDLSAEEIGKVVDYCNAQRGVHGAFLRVTFALLIGGGLRATELCTLLLQGYMDDGRLRFIGKGDKESEIPIGPGEQGAIDAWLPTRKVLDPGAWLVVRPNGAQLSTSILGHLCTNVARASGVAPFTPHDCRRTLATRLLDAGIDLARVQRILRHTDPATTAQYDKRTKDQDAVARRTVELWRAK